MFLNQMRPQIFGQCAVASWPRTGRQGGVEVLHSGFSKGFCFTLG